MFKKLREWAVGNKKFLTPLLFFFVSILFGIFLLVLSAQYLGTYAPLDQELNEENISEEQEKEEEETPTEPDSTVDSQVIKGLTVRFLGTPKVVDKEFNLEKPTKYEDGTTTDIDDELKTVYKTADVVAGTYMDESLAGCEVYVLKYESYGDAARVISCSTNSTVYVLQSYAIENGPFFGEDEANVVHVAGDDALYDAFSNPYLKRANTKVTSDKGVVFEIGSHRLELYKSSELVKVDSIKEWDVYDLVTGGKGELLVKTPEGFYQILVLEPGIVYYDKDQEYDPKVSIALTKGGSFNAVYDYVSIGGCFNNYLEIEETSMSTLTKIGVGKNGDNIYQKSDRNDAYLKKIYADDYALKDGGVYEWNSIKDDDDAPYSYEKFIDSYPVIYWQDPYGRIVKFARRDFVMTGGCAKPIIYLYPESPTDLNVQVIPNGHLTFTYPKYPTNGWDVKAYPDGMIVHKGLKYEYLWWESVSNGFVKPVNGWVVEKTKAEEKIVSVLETYGLNQKEIADFVEFWIPQITKEESRYVYLTFLFGKQVDQIAEVKVSQTPDTLLRVFMVYEPLDSYKVVKPLNVEKVTREGFTVVEWGGARF